MLWRYLDWVSLVILAAAIISAAVPNDGSRGWTSFTLLIIELNLIVWVGYFTDRNAGNAIKELEVCCVAGFGETVIHQKPQPGALCPALRVQA